MSAIVRSLPVQTGTHGKPGTPGKPGKSGKRHYGTHIFLIVMAAMWLTPLVWSLYTALRPKADTDKHGYFSFGGSFGFENFVQAWNQGGFSKYFLNSVLITVPAVLFTLLFASMMAFAVSRVSWKFNVTLLIMFTAGNLLPPQVLHLHAPLLPPPGTCRCRPCQAPDPASWR